MKPSVVAAMSLHSRQWINLALRFCAASGAGNLTFSIGISDGHDVNTATIEPCSDMLQSIVIPDA